MVQAVLNPEKSKTLSSRKLCLYLIKPSKYDDDGYVIRYWKGVLPSNTLACLYGLTLDLKERKVFGNDFEWDIRAVDDTVQKIPFSQIVRSARNKTTKTLVCLVGVQSNQFPRAYDLAMEFRKKGIDVLMGGFHISGILSTLEKLPEDLLKLQRAGVSLVAGEIEGRWEAILKDALDEDLKSIYDFLKKPPELSCAPLPRVPRNLLDHYAVSHFATLDCGRGCPYECGFCTVINVQGRRMRFRNVEAIMQRLRQNYREHRIAHYFFTDDNFCRNKNWEPIFDALIRLRKEEGLPLSFMIQVDTQSFRVASFIEKAAQAGCTQVFIGMESINEENLAAAGKKQNRVADFKALIEAYQNVGIVTHLAYIIGFPYDTEESVARDMEKLQQELGAEQASFFMLTPLPGSMDYRQALSKKVFMDADLNNFDSFHETVRHPKMIKGAWTRAYAKAWKTFYGPENMKRILGKTRRHKYWDIFLNFVWYKNAVEVEGGHPMVHGFVRRKGRAERRSCFPRESLFVYAKRRWKDFHRTLLGWIKLAFEMEEVWLATRHRTPLEEKVLEELAHYKKHWEDWRTLRLTELQGLYGRAAGRLAFKINTPSFIHLWIKRWDFFSDPFTVSRYPMIRFWKKSLRRLQKRQFYSVNFFRIILTVFCEAVLLSRFLKALLQRRLSGSYETR